MTILTPFTLAVLSWVLVSPTNGQDNTTCQGTALDWYTDVVGETPCQTYQRLHQICDPDYEVVHFNAKTPPDHCTDQLASCCCNSIAFALSMLCLNCQQNIGSGSGFDAAPGTYQAYLTRSDGNKCGPNVNQSLPTDIQSAVCNTQTKLENSLYGLFWVGGDWYYEYTKDTINKDHLADNNNTFTHCASTTLRNITSSAVSASSTTSSSVSSTSVAHNDTSSSTFNHPGPIVGVVVGVVVFIAVIIILLWLRRRRTSLSRAHSGADLGRGNGPSMLAATPYITGHLQPHPMAQSTSDMIPVSTTRAMTSSTETVSPSRGSGQSSGSSAKNPSAITSTSSPSHVRLDSVPSDFWRSPPAYGEQV